MKEKEQNYLKQIEAIEKLLKEKSTRPLTPPKPSTPPSAAANTIDSLK
jgi:hypothetical protein